MKKILLSLIFITNLFAGKAFASACGNAILSETSLGCICEKFPNSTSCLNFRFFEVYSAQENRRFGKKIVEKLSDQDTVHGTSNFQRSSNPVKANPNPTLPSQNDQTAAFDSQALDGFEESCINSCQDQVRVCVNETELVEGMRDFKGCREIWSHCFPYCQKEDVEDFVCEEYVKNFCELEWLLPCPYELSDKCNAVGYKGGPQYGGHNGFYDQCVNDNYLKICILRNGSKNARDRVVREGR